MKEKEHVSAEDHLQGNKGSLGHRQHKKTKVRDRDREMRKESAKRDYTEQWFPIDCKRRAVNRRLGVCIV